MREIPHAAVALSWATCRGSNGQKNAHTDGERRRRAVAKKPPIQSDSADSSERTAARTDDPSGESGPYASVLSPMTVTLG